MSIVRCEKCEKTIDMDFEETETIDDKIYCLNCSDSFNTLEIDQMNKKEMKIYDKNERLIREHDLLKIYHFTGARRKKYYMYKWVVEREGKLRCIHLEKENEKGYPLFFITEEGTEIIQGSELETRDKRTDTQE